MVENGKIGSWDAIFFYEMHLNGRKCLYTSKKLQLPTTFLKNGSAQQVVRQVNKLKLALYRDVNFSKIDRVNPKEYDYVLKQN